MIFESKAPSPAVAVWGNGSRFTQTTVSPWRTVSGSGLNATASITPVCVGVRRGAFGSTASESIPAGQPDNTSHAAHNSARATRPLSRWRPRGTASPLTGSLETGLYLLRLLEMRHEGRPRLREQLLELGVLRVRDQRLVHRVEHALVVHDLVIDVFLVELFAAEPPQL